MTDRRLPYRLTQEGLNQLNKRLLELKERLAKLLSQKRETAISQGDYWHDNPAFNQLEMEERALRLQIRDIRDKLARAIIVDEENQTDEIKIGSFVEIIFEGGRRMELTVVDPETSDPKKGLISYVSPLGEALLGARTGDIRRYSVRENEFRIEVIRIGKKNGG